jgi:hypothetical protein
MNNRLLLILALGLSAACMAAARREAMIRERAPFDLDCPNEKIEVQDLGSGVLGARGCGAKASYVIGYSGPVLNSLEKQGKTDVNPVKP